ncbi:MAG TPA: hypothetical protein VGK04_05310, partial [Thermoanaerobaculia bacterium]
MRKLSLIVVLCAAAPIVAACAGEIAETTPAEHDFVVRDFRFATGETLPEVRIHYVTIGTQRGGNAVLILHGTGGSSKQFLNDHFSGVLFKTGGLLDASRFFIVIPDNIGH